MSDFNLVDPRGWEYDLQSVYSAYMGHFQLHGIPWYERTWGIFFESFEEFLTFSWPCIVVTDAFTGKAHIVTRMTSIGAFLKMIKTRFGETLPIVDNMLRVTPFETSQRHLRTVTDFAIYKKLFSTLPAAVLSAMKLRVRDGDPKRIRELWNSKDKTFLAVSFEWSERNMSSCLEFGYSAARCSHLDAVGVWPPDPEVNYRRGHYIVAEYVDKVFNRHRPNFPWTYAFGDSQVVPKAKLPQVIQAVISSLSSPDSETTPNSLVLVAHGLNGDLRRLEEMKIKIPHNVLVIDTAMYERQLFSVGLRGEMRDVTGQPRVQGSTLSLMNLTQSLGVNAQGIMHNAGNDAFLCLLNLQLILDPEVTKIPNLRGSNVQQALMHNGSRSPTMAMGGMLTMPMAMGTPIMPMYGVMPMVASSPRLFPQMTGSLTPDSYLEDGSSSRKGSPNQPSPGGRLRKASNLSLAERDRRGSMTRVISAGTIGTNGVNGAVNEAAEKMNGLRVG